MATDEVILVGIDEAAHRVHLSRDTLYKAVAAGEIPYVKRGKRQRLLDVADLQKWVDRQKVSANGI